MNGKIWQILDGIVFFVGLSAFILGTASGVWCVLTWLKATGFDPTAGDMFWGSVGLLIVLGLITLIMKRIRA